MVDVFHHFELVERHLGTCCRTAIALEVEGPHFTPNREKWKVIVLNATIEWPTGEKLVIGDYWVRGEKRQDVRHTFHYQFMRSDCACIFRLDTEGEEIPYDGKCHLHIGPNEERFDDDDSQLHGLRLSEVNLLTVFALVHLHLNGDPLPWDDPE
jgi:hypothetical protein